MKQIGMTALLSTLALAASLVACGSDDASPPSGESGSGGTAGTGGASGAAGTGGAAGAAGTTAGAGGAGASGAGASGAGASGAGAAGAGAAGAGAAGASGLSAGGTAGTGGASGASGAGGASGASGAGGAGAAGAAGSGGEAGSAGAGAGGVAGGSGAAGAGSESGFVPGHVFIAGSRNAQVFEYDASLQPVGSWTDPSFGTVMPPPGQNFALGPAGMVFDVNGHLVVAGAKEFCVFSAPGKLVACHPKVDAEPTENVIFDSDSNLYTTTSTGGTSLVRKYDKNYAPVTTFTLPTQNLTGITCDPDGNLFVASQTAGGSVIYKADKATFQVLDTIAVDGIAEGLQYAPDGNLFVALQQSKGVARIKPSSPSSVLGAATDPDLLFAVPVTTDTLGRLYTADYENGSGTSPADIFVFDASGKLVTSRLKSEVYGPFGIVVAGAVLPCGAFKP